MADKQYTGLVTIAVSVGDGDFDAVEKVHNGLDKEIQHAVERYLTLLMLDDRDLYERVMIYWPDVPAIEVDPTGVEPLADYCEALNARTWGRPTSE